MRIMEDTCGQKLEVDENLLNEQNIQVPANKSFSRCVTLGKFLNHLCLGFPHP